MKNLKKLILAFAVMVAGTLPAYSQWTEEEIDKMLTYELDVENPVHMPVLGIGTGFFNFYGNVNDAFRSYTVGKPGIRVNMATYLDRQNHYFRGNLVFMTGELSGTQRLVSDTSMLKNLNFKSNIYSFGINFHYSFKPWLKSKIFEPFISLGVETLQFDTKADYENNNGRYHYWPDGSIRGVPWWTGFDPNVDDVPLISRDYIYETDLRSENQSGLGKYSQFAIAIPVDIGVDFNVSSRITLRAATSLHYAFTDLIDDMSSKANKNPEYKGKGRNNMYTFSYLSLNVDLFSPPRTKTIEGLMGNIDDFDFTMFDDQDGDGVFDRWDKCPDTPPGLEVDSIGCPFDDDKDGVPNYLDREPNSRPGAIVDEYGVEINENMVVEVLNDMAILRSDVESYLMVRKMQNRARREGVLPIPEKFKRVDANSDGYISFDELLKTINNVFDDASGYSPSDIKELIDFFFDQ